MWKRQQIKKKTNMTESLSLDFENTNVRIFPIQKL